MPENEFEKKVASDMQDLKFKPSENVWLRVEERIKKKKKRRIYVVIFLLAGLALLGYWQRNNLFEKSENDIANTVQKDSPGEKQNDENSGSAQETNNSSTIKQNTETEKKEETRNTTEKTVKDKLNDDKTDIAVSKNEINVPKRNKDGTNVKQVSEKTKKDDRPEVSIAVTQADSKKRSTIVDDGKADTLAVKTNTETIIKQDEVKQPEVEPLENEIDSAIAQLPEQEKISSEKTDTTLKTDQAKAPTTPIVKIDSSVKKWKWGLHITPGLSALSDQGLSISSQNSADRFSYQTPASGGSAAPPTRQKPSDVEAGFALQAGVFTQRQLSTRTSLAIGLQYGYYSNVLRIGNRRDSLINNNQFANVFDGNANSVYNAGGDTTKYTNQYHFVELPLSFQWQLNKNKAKPFTWSTGFTIGQLVASNAIMYDTAFNGIYYQNKKLLNKTQFSLSTGFSWTIANNKKVQWSLGPVANIHLNKLVDNPFENKGYLFFVGLRTGILFNQKNNARPNVPK